MPVFSQKDIYREVSSYDNDVCTPPKTNMSPEKWWLEDEMSFWDVVPFLGTCLFSGAVYIIVKKYQALSTV